MKKLVVLMLLASMLFTAGCAEKTPEKNPVVVITNLEQINTSLQNGPVFVKMGSIWCSGCRSLKPTIEKLAAEYEGNATIASIDVNKNRELTEYFGVTYIPDSFVIVGIDDGKYVYMQENGNISMDRSEARFVGLNESNEKVFKKVLDLALIQQSKDKSK